MDLLCVRPFVSQCDSSSLSGCLLVSMSGREETSARDDLVRLGMNRVAIGILSWNLVGKMQLVAHLLLLISQRKR